MSYPASGFEKVYRNNISDVANFLKLKHGSHYKVFNMSGRQYEFSKFEGKVETFDWQDHHSPPIHILF